jgi:small subunit ribosomal protein S4e
MSLCWPHAIITDGRDIFQYKLCRVVRVQVGPKGVPFIVTHDGRTIRYPDPLVKVNDSVVLDIASGKMKDFIKFDSGT